MPCPSRLLCSRGGISRLPICPSMPQYSLKIIVRVDGIIIIIILNYVLQYIKKSDIPKHNSSYLYLYTCSKFLTLKLTVTYQPPNSLLYVPRTPSRKTAVQRKKFQEDFALVSAHHLSSATSQSKILFQKIVPLSPLPPRRHLLQPRKLAYRLRRPCWLGPRNQRRRPWWPFRSGERGHKKREENGERLRGCLFSHTKKSQVTFDSICQLTRY